MRGDNNTRFTAARVIDTEGKLHFHVVPTKWVSFGLVGFILMLVLAVVMGLLILSNKTDIERLREEIKIEEQK